MSPMSPRRVGEAAHFRPGRGQPGRGGDPGRRVAAFRRLLQGGPRALHFRRARPGAVAGPGRNGRPSWTLKLYDIPATMRRSAAAASRLGARFITIHDAGAGAAGRPGGNRRFSPAGPLRHPAHECGCPGPARPRRTGFGRTVSGTWTNTSAGGPGPRSPTAATD